ncbi:MAG: hypothetical protein PHG97_01325 [Candidatus Margulisbacteria bacterium]|nr:hypothetical protein [Candidatus Margulisiibacteriota bacterium]
MTIQKIINAVRFPSEFMATYTLFRDLGADPVEAIRNSLACLVLVA